MSEPMICVDRLAKSFGAHQVLRDVSLNISAGQTFALLGRNGAGKTTTIRIMLGLIPADSGTVQVAGFDPSNDPLKLRSQVGYLAEDQTMYGWMTPIELCHFLAPFYPTWDMDWARDYLDRFHIPLHTRIRRLSKGQTVKLGLTVALAHRPPVVVLDDPAMGLDPISRKEFNRDLVEHLQSSGCTVLYSSHLLDEVKQILLPLDSVAGSPQPDGLLDARRHGDRLAIIVDQVDGYLQQLSSEGIEHDVVDLRLDEIFEAFVIGRNEDWPNEATNAVVSV